MKKVYEKAIQKAIDEGKYDALPQLEGRLDELERAEAMSSLNASLSKVAAGLPAVAKTSATDRSKYADYLDVMKALKPLLDQERLSLAFTSDAVERGIELCLTVRNHLGGSRSFSGVFPVWEGITRARDGVAVTNASQNMVGALTYARRTLLCMAFNITVRGDDQDGFDGPAPITEDDLRGIKRMLREMGDDEAHVHDALLKDFEVDALEGLSKKDGVRAYIEMERRVAQKNKPDPALASLERKLSEAKDEASVAALKAQWEASGRIDDATKARGLKLIEEFEFNAGLV